MKKSQKFFILLALSNFMLITTLKAMSNIQEEIWKDIPRYEGFYKVSNSGQVKSVDRICIQSDGKVLKLKEKNLKFAKDKKGYHRYRLSKNNNLSSFRAHRLVAISFIPNPDNKPQVNHKNGNRKDNRVENLEWCTNQENNHHSWRELGRKSLGSPWSKKSVYQFTMDGIFITSFPSVQDAIVATGIRHISSVARGARNHAGGFKWTYNPL